MSEFNINDIPPEEISNMQLLMLVRDLRTESRDRATREEKMVASIDTLATKVDSLGKSFDAATTVVRMIKWMAAFGVATIGIVEAMRRLIPWGSGG